MALWLSVTPNTRRLVPSVRTPMALWLSVTPIETPAEAEARYAECDDE